MNNNIVISKTIVENRTVEEIKSWMPERIRQCCIDYQWFTCGSNAAYEILLDYVRDHKPTLDNLFHTACFIYQNSIWEKEIENSRYTKDEVIESIMFHLNCEVIVTSYYIRN